MFPDPPPAETPAVFPSPTVSDALPIPSPSDAQNGEALAVSVTALDSTTFTREHLCLKEVAARTELDCAYDVAEMLEWFACACAFADGELALLSGALRRPTLRHC
ncbi:hypothetical protein AURDEDRAFT_159308 [Auricularia subglabra TFB-10046 SS5]|nr:hypothetical protein AURDEDRAFT_159308 [Auricularia subglabra TFB-10046 SS5]